MTGGYVRLAVNIVERKILLGNIDIFRISEVRYFVDKGVEPTQRGRPVRAGHRGMDASGGARAAGFSSFYV
jgi:hypothetical protein